MARLPYLRCLHLSFCVRLTDAALLHLAGGARGGAAGPTGSASGAAADRAVAATGEGQAAGLAAAPAAQNGAAAQSGGPQGTPLLEQLELYHCPQVHRCAGLAWFGTTGGTCLQRATGTCPLHSSLCPCPPHTGPHAACLPDWLQVTHRGLWSLVQACPHLLHLNIGAPLAWQAGIPCCSAKARPRMGGRPPQAVLLLLPGARAPTHPCPCPYPATADAAGKCRQVRADSLRPLLAARPALRLTACHYLDS